MSRYPALGFDPAPGDPDEVARLGRETARAAGEVDQLADELRRLRCADWRGLAAESFAVALDRLPQQLAVAQEAFGEVAGRLSGWASALEDLQAQARAAEREAADALDQLRVARACAPSRLASGSAEAYTGYLEAVQTTGRAVAAAEQALAAARARGAAVRERAQEQAARVERAVRDAARVAPPEPGWLERVGSSVLDGVRALNDAAGEFVRDNREVIGAFTDALSTAAFVAAFIPGVNGIALLVAGAVVLADTGLLAAYTDDRDAGDVALAAVGLGLGGAAHLAGNAARAARAAETGTAVRSLPSLFTPGLTMGSRELAWRTVQLQPTLAGHAVALVDTTGTARRRGLLPAAAPAVRHAEAGRVVTSGAVR